MRARLHESRTCAQEEVGALERRLREQQEARLEAERMLRVRSLKLEGDKVYPTRIERKPAAAC